MLWVINRMTIVIKNYVFGLCSLLPIISDCDQRNVCVYITWLDLFELLVIQSRIFSKQSVTMWLLWMTVILSYCMTMINNIEYRTLFHKITNQWIVKWEHIQETRFMLIIAIIIICQTIWKLFKLLLFNEWTERR